MAVRYEMRKFICARIHLRYRGAPPCRLLPQNMRKFAAAFVVTDPHRRRRLSE